MINPVEFDEVTLKRVPYAFVLIIILLLGLPMVALVQGIDFVSLARQASPEGVGNMLLESEIRAYFRQTLLQWSAFSLSVVTVLLAFTQYKLAKDKIALVIGLSVLFSGLVQAMHTVFIDGISLQLYEKDNLDALIWTFSNTVSGVIFLLGLLLLLVHQDRYEVRVPSFILLSLLLISIAFALIYYIASITKLPNMWYSESVLSRPYELSYVLIYLVILLFIYPATYKRHPTILTNCIFYMSVTQVVMGIYLMLVSGSPYDSGFYIGYFLKIVVYFIPFACLVINYVFSYQVVLRAQVILKENQEKLKHLAAHDALTNLYNRREFEELLDKSVANFRRQKHQFALMILDVDNFKSINDTLGHVYGDEFLKQFALRLLDTVRHGDIVARIGGDEFAIISSRLRNTADPRHFAERVLENLRPPYSMGNKFLTSTISIGIAIYPEDGVNAADLLKNADIAMYSAKRSGKNTYRFYTEKLTQQQHREAQVETYLRDAVNNHELTLYYQPKFDLVTKEILGAEVLLRWHHPSLGHVSPAEFIPIAENNGLMIDIGEWVLKETCRQAQAWRDKYNTHMMFSVNISPIQLDQPGFFDLIKNTLLHYNLPPDSLDIEITETYLMLSSDSAREVLNQIDALGVNISIDDFGIGYSSLSRLKLMPIDTLKIDKLFVSDIEDENSRVVLVDLIIKLAEELGMNIIAEGVETEIQLNYLVARNCRMAQGYLLSKPIGASEFEALAFAGVTSTESNKGQESLK